MFTGIITDLGQVRRISVNGDTRMEFTTAFDTSGVEIGASIACSGVCLTVIDKGNDWFAVQVSNETLSCTTLKYWQDTTFVNFERALKVGDELGGHMVSGHVDGMAEIIDIQPDDGSKRFTFKAPASLFAMIASKGSVTIDGISLTVNEVSGDQFGINVIPHTLGVTTLGKKRTGDIVNLEVDMLVRYVARLLNKE